MLVFIDESGYPRPTDGNGFSISEKHLPIMKNGYMNCIK